MCDAVPCAGLELMAPASTLVLPRVLASRASDISKRLKHHILQLKTSWAVLSRKCSSVEL